MRSHKTAAYAVRQRTLTTRRPWLEVLEERLAPATFVEDFTSDTNPSAGGLDTAGGQIGIYSEVFGGEPVFVSNEVGSGLFQGSPPHALALSGVMTYHLVHDRNGDDPGNGYALGAPEASVKVAGSGIFVTFYGATDYYLPLGSGGLITLHGAPNSYSPLPNLTSPAWTLLSATRDTITPSGQPLGNIVDITVAVFPGSAGVVYVDDVTYEIPVNGAPQANPDTVFVSLATGASGVFLPQDNDSDPENDALEIVGYADPPNGRLQPVGRGFVYHLDRNTDGSLVIPAAPGAIVDSFQYTIRDGFGNTATQTVTLQFQDEPPWIGLESRQGREDFNDDLNPEQPGFDSFDVFPSFDLNPDAADIPTTVKDERRFQTDDPDTPEDESLLAYDDPGTPNTLVPDWLHILNNLPAPTSSTSTLLSGALAGGGLYRVGTPGAGEPQVPPGAGPNRLLVAGGSVTFSFPPAGSPGSHDIGLDIVMMGVQVVGQGLLKVEGTGGVFTQPFDSDSYFPAILIGSDHQLAPDQELGGIQRITITSTGQALIGGVTAFVGEISANRPPLAVPDVAGVNADNGTAIFRLLANDSDPDLEAFFLQSFTQPQALTGTVTRLDFDSFRYQASDPAAFRNNPDLRDQFTYTIVDERGATATATVQVRLNTPPLAQPDVYTLPHGFRDSFTSSIVGFGPNSVRSNDRDADGDTLVVEAGLLRQPTEPQLPRLPDAPLHGTVRIDELGVFTYTTTEPGGLIVNDSFNYAIWDGVANPIKVPVTITVPNATPTVDSFSIDLAHGAQETVRGLLHPFDQDGDGLQVRVVVPPMHGGVGFHVNGTFLEAVDGFAGDLDFEYLPDSEAVIGPDAFTIEVADMYGATATATVQIRAPNRRPEIVADESQVFPFPVPPDFVAQVVQAGTTVLSAAGGATIERVLFGQTKEDTGFPPATLVYAQGQVAIAYDADGDRLTPLLVAQPEHGDVVFFRGEFEISGEERIVLRADGVPSAVVDKIGNVSGATEQEFLDILRGRLTNSELTEFASSILKRAEFQWLFRYQQDPGDLVFGTDSFTFRFTDGHQETRDVIRGDIEQSLGFVRLEDDVVVVQRLGFREDPAGGFVERAGPFYPEALLRNDWFGRLERDVHGAAHFIPETSAATLVPYVLFGYDTLNDAYTRNHVENADQDEFPVVRRDRNETSITPTDFLRVRADEAMYFTDVAAGHDAPEVQHLTYHFEYSGPGLDGTIVSPTAHVTLILVDEPNADNDGISDETEAEVPARSGVAGDGNGDNVADSLQSNVASLENAEDGRYVTIAAPTGYTVVGIDASDDLVDLLSLDDDVVSAPPGGSSAFPVGFFAFEIAPVPPEGHVTVNLYLPERVRVNAYYKFIRDAWVNFLYDPASATGAKFYDVNGVENGPDYTARIELHFVEGGRGDYSAGRDGVIRDPGGPAFLLFEPIGERTVAHVQDRLDVSIVPLVQADTLTLSHTAGTLAYVLDQLYSLQFGGSFFENWGGRGERWLWGDEGWYFILPDGTFCRWSGDPNTASGVELGTLPPIFYVWPRLLFNATPGDLAQALDLYLGLYSTGNLWEGWGGQGERWLAGEGGASYFITPDGRFLAWDGSWPATGTLLAMLPPTYFEEIGRLVDAHAAPFSVALTGGRLTVDPPHGFAGELYVGVTAADGTSHASEIVRIAVDYRPPALAAIADQVIPADRNSLTLTPGIDNPVGAALTYAARAGTLAYLLDQQYHLEFWGSYFEGVTDARARWLRSAEGAWFYVLPDGSFHRWNWTDLGSSTLVATLDPEIYQHPELLYDAQPARADQFDVSYVNGELTINVAAGFAGDVFVAYQIGDGITTSSRRFRASRLST